VTELIQQNIAVNKHIFCDKNMFPFNQVYDNCNKFQLKFIYHYNFLKKKKNSRFMARRFSAKNYSSSFNLTNHNKKGEFPRSSFFGQLIVWRPANTAMGHSRHVQQQHGMINKHVTIMKMKRKSVTN